MRKKTQDDFMQYAQKKCPFFLLIILTIILVNDILTKNSNK